MRQHPLLLILGLFTLTLGACRGTDIPAPSLPDAQTQPSPSGSASPTVAPVAGTLASAPSGEPIRVGVLCDRSGLGASTQIYLCDAIADWAEYISTSAGGVKGRPVAFPEVDFKFEIPLGVDSYKRLYTRDAVRQFIPLGSSLVEALSESSAQDKSVLWAPGFGLSAHVDGRAFPYMFPAAASYTAQAQAGLGFIAEEWQAQGKAGRPKVIYLHVDNPGGRDPLEVIQQQGPSLDVEILDTVAVPNTSVDLSTFFAQIKDQTPDYVLSHLFGRHTALELQAAEKAGFPRERMIGLVWALDEDAVHLAGPTAAEGFRGLQFAAHPSDNPRAYQLLEASWQTNGKAPNPRARQSLLYARGLVLAALPLEAARLAEDPTDGDSLKRGAESINNFTANELLPPITLTPEDHAGTRKVRMYQVTEGKIQQIRDWFESPLH